MSLLSRGPFSFNSCFYRLYFCTHVDCELFSPLKKKKYWFSAGGTKEWFWLVKVMVGEEEGLVMCVCVCVCQHHTQVPPRVKETGNWSSKSDVPKVVYLSVEKKLRVGNLFPGAEGSNVEIVLHFPSPRLLPGCITPSQTASVDTSLREAMIARVRAWRQEAADQHQTFSLTGTETSENRYIFHDINSNSSTGLYYGLRWWD